MLLRSLYLSQPKVAAKEGALASRDTHYRFNVIFLPTRLLREY